MERIMVITMDTIYDTFFLNGDKFTIEDYDTTSFGVYHEDMFVGTCTEPTAKAGIPVAVKYYAQCHR